MGEWGDKGTRGQGDGAIAISRLTEVGFLPEISVTPQNNHKNPTFCPTRQI
ncbi:MAG: hypothetical protein VKN72_29670 [Nostocales cyanobacterium 94392]|nr:hypothetical protein [Nostocales cyanobacterium 94392]